MPINEKESYDVFVSFFVLDEQRDVSTGTIKTVWHPTTVVVTMPHKISTRQDLFVLRENIVRELGKVMQNQSGIFGQRPIIEISHWQYLGE